MAQPSVFGEIPGFPSGTEFDDREGARVAGLHRHPMNGISGNPVEGADAIVVSGHYGDLDFGDRIVYTGEGGQEKGIQVRDQTLTKGNLALARAEETGYPVRVIRGAGGDADHSPATGYRYDGLFVVTEHWKEPSPEGPLVWRYVLERSDGGTDWRGTAPPDGEETPDRVRSVVQRVVRNSKITQWVKDAHDGVCQFCGIRLETAAGYYAEGAHIRALGAPHNGPDVVSNVLCLCPNDHVLFDKGALYLDAGQVFRTSDAVALGPLRSVPKHTIDWTHAEYHREHFAKAN